MNILATGMGWIEHTPGGLNRYFADYLKAMSDYGHEVRGLMTASGESTTAPGYMEDVIRKQEPAGTLTRSRAFRQAFAAQAKRKRPDIYNPHFALYASLITRNLVPQGVPIVTHFHGPWAQEGMVEDKGIGQKLRFQLKKNVELLSYRRSDHFIVLSRYFRDILARDYGMDSDRIHVIPGAVDTQRFRPAPDRRMVREQLGLREDQPVLFCARRLVPRMGIDHLIRAMVRVKREKPETVLYIAGSGIMGKQLEQLASELQLGETVRFLGRVSNEDLVRWYQAADLSIVPTLTLEGFGLVTVEAMACGTPVIGTPYGGTKEILDGLSEELLFADSSPEAMAEKLCSVLQGRTAIPSRQECLDYVLSRYTWDRVAGAVTHVFEQASDKGKGHATR
ncbi:Glycosyltransferase involved in cell wall bisynthesis [Paenibacillus sp. UNCCL117]|uniref:glycosyltransferase family 4 protein n=1 Tax=unclassified Paenibacillus TaxID=185978 RepID=UPI00088E8CBE|nr:MULTISPECIES: glycosyltransferase family 4 protein [unclassified Paenibacillus]SDC03075.1 Glycosyltransferase involved in cell wall bisynthesis [Paenibacillus sp. cl123]SFW36993.1 Glycosyltransferase involved in cell wall bisynthesis [Paenibacillus sp. UNCCL117]